MKFDIFGFDLFEYIIDCIKNNFCLGVKKIGSSIDKEFYLNICDAYHLIEYEDQLNIDNYSDEIGYKIIKLVKPTSEFRLEKEITNFEFISSKNKYVFKEITSIRINDNHGYIYMFYNDFREFFEYLYCCLSLVNDENLKKCRQKKNQLFFNESKSSNGQNYNNNEDKKERHYFDNSCFIRTDNENENPQNKNSEIKHNINVHVKENKLLKKNKRSGSSELKKVSEENEEIEKIPLDLRKEKELFKAKFDKAFGKESNKPQTNANEKVDSSKEPLKKDELNVNKIF